MKKTKIFIPLIATLMAMSVATSCNQQGTGSTTDNPNGIDSAALPALKGDEDLNRAARFYGGISNEGIAMADSDSRAWNDYSREIKKLLDISSKTRHKVDSLVAADFSDFRDSIDMVFYPFSSADFLYPITIFPNADTFVLGGLEKTGSPFGSKIKTNYTHYQAYRKALSKFLRISYFVTKDMKEELDNEELVGVCPIISMLMASAGYEIISINNMAIDDSGQLIPGDGNGNVMEFKFFRTGSKHEQTLYYLSADLANSRTDENVKKFIETTLPGHKVATYLKAASYLMHMPGFSKIRDYITDFSQYIIEDDSGVPYKYLTDKFDVTLYGVYKRPLSVFTDSCIQHDLDQAYKANASQVRKLPFYIGYNTPSNWQCARRKPTK